MKSDELEKEIVAYLEEIPDPRSKRGIRYRYADLLLMALYSVLAGYSEGTEIEYYVELHFEYFQKLLGLKSVPSHDTFSRLLQMTDIEELGKNIGKWIAENFPDICEKIDGNRILHIDGKAVRAASEKSAGERPIYNLNAMYEGEGISLYLKRVGEKENEISTLPAYLNLFDLKNTIVTIDAIGCNQTVINAILEKKGHYMIPVKENQPRLRKCIMNKVEVMEKDGTLKKQEYAERTIKMHGRIETMKMYILKNTDFIYEELGLDSFFGSIARVGIIDKKTVRKENGEEKETYQRSVVITDLQKISVENMLNIKLSHWNVEAQHWILDVQMDEDKKTARRGNAVSNGAILRRFCLLMRKYTPEYESKPLKRFLMANANDIQRIENLLFLKTQK